MITYNEALSVAKSGNAVFILGSGFSIGAKNIDDKQLLQGNGLAKKIAEAIPISADFSLEMIAQQYINQYGEYELLQLLKKQFLVKKFDEKYNALAQLNKIHIYSTNYDDLIERIFFSNKKSINSYELSDNCIKASKGRFILHINGKITEDVENIDGIRLSASSYDKDFSKSPWIKYLADDINSSEAVFIIGHSLFSDLDIKRLIANYRDKCFIIQHPDLDKNLQEILAGYGRVCENGVFQFLEDVSNASEKIIPKDYKNSKFKSFKKLIREQILVEPSDQEIFDFFIKGSVSRSVFYQDYNQKFFSLINRQALTKAIFCLENGKDLVVHSDLGNGKTVFLRQLVQKMSNKNFVIYECNNTADFPRELRQLSKLNENIVVVFDVYNSCYEEIECIKNYAGSELQFILMARSAMHDNYEKRIEEDLSEFDIEEINLNHLNKEECVELDAILKRHGLWGEDAALNDVKRLDILINRCKSSLQAIILYLFESSDIKRKFEDIISFEKRLKYRKLLILSFINSVLELKLSDSDLNIIYPEMNINRMYRDSLFEEFMHNDYLSWNVKSPIVAKSMLNSSAFSKKEIVVNLIDLTLKLDELNTDGYYPYNYALKNLGYKCRHIKIFS